MFFFTRLFFCRTKAQFGLGRVIVEVCKITRSYAHTPGSTLLNEWSDCHRGPYVHNTQQTQETHFHALRGIGTRNRSNRAAAELHLRPHGHRDRPVFTMLQFFFFLLGTNSLKI